MGLYNTFGIIAGVADSLKLPLGAIIMWDGLESEIPDGWIKCDGTNGTPNLIDKFIMGTNTESSIGNTGGRSSVILTESTMPKHRHAFATNQDGSHSHAFEVSRHSYSFAGRAFVDYDTDNPKGPAWGYTEYSGAHSHSVPDTVSAGTNNPLAINIQPSFMTMIYIMKVG